MINTIQELNFSRLHKSIESCYVYTLILRYIDHLKNIQIVHKQLNYFFDCFKSEYVCNKIPCRLEFTEIHQYHIMFYELVHYLSICLLCKQVESQAHFFRFSTLLKLYYCIPLDNSTSLVIRLNISWLKHICNVRYCILIEEISKLDAYSND